MAEQESREEKTGGDREGTSGGGGGGERRARPPGRSQQGRRPPRGRSGGGGRFRRRPRVCGFCASKVAYVDYKDVDALRRYVTDRGKIRPRRQSGTCSRHQRELATAVKRARHLALLPFTAGTSQE